MKHISHLAAYLIAALFFATGCSTFFKRTPAQIAALPKHYILTLHGVRGNEASYGQFHELIKLHLEKIDPSFEVIPLNLTYKTAQTDFTPHKAAAEINAKLDKLIPVFNPQDKISVVAYSMGGQVGVAWYYDSLKDAVHSKYPKQTSNFVSLGAAFWGAEEAALFANDANTTVKLAMKNLIKELNVRSQKLTNQYLGEVTASRLAKTQNDINVDLFKRIDSMNNLSDIQNFYDNKMIKDYYGKDRLEILDSIDLLKEIRHSTLKSLAKISFAELQSLAIAGHSVIDLRSLMISKLDEKGVPTKTATKWTNISTLVPCFESDLGSQTPGCDDFQNKLFGDVNAGFSKVSFGLKRRETDNAVITPSSVAQFYWTYDSNPNYSVNQVTPRANFLYSLDPDNQKVIFAETLHATLVTEKMYDKLFNVLGHLGKSEQGLADDVVIVHKEKCLTPENCDHPVYKYELEALADCDQPGSKCEHPELIKQFQHRNSSEMPIEQAQSRLKSELHGFTLELNLRVPFSYDISKINESNIFDIIKMDFDENSKLDRQLRLSPSLPYAMQVGRRYEMASILVNKISYPGQKQKHLKINLTGIISPNGANYNSEELQKGVPLNFGIVLPGLKPRQIEAVVSPYHSTFIDLMMAQ